MEGEETPAPFNPDDIKVTRDLGSAPEERPRRGRRAKSTLGATDTPENGASPAGSEPKQRRKRRAKPLDPLEVEKLAKQLKGIHALAAMGTGFGELQLSDMDANMLAEAFATVSREYDVEFNGKTAATIQLIGTACLIYLPRLASINNRVKARKHQHAAETLGTEAAHGTAA